MIGDKRIRHIAGPKAITLGYIPSNDYGKNGDTVYVKDGKTNSTEPFVKTDGTWISLSTGKGASDLKRRAGTKGASSAVATTIQNITVQEAEGTGGAVVNHDDLLELTDDDHTQYVHNTTARTVSAAHTFSGNLALTGQPTFSGNALFTGVPVFDDIDINGGNISASTISGGLTWNSAQNLNSQILTNVNIDSGTINGITDLAIVDGGTGASNSNAWLNSRITTNANGSLNYNATGATAVNHDSLADFVADEHKDHTTISVTAGTGLTGGGTIAATRTLNVVGGTAITANANDIQVTNDSIGDTQLTFNTGQHLTTLHSPEFVALTLSKADGTTPMTVTSTTVVTNLNADYLDGYHESSFFRLAQDEEVTGVPSFTGGDVTTAPFAVDSAFLVTNLNADKADGYDFNQDVQTTASPQFSNMTVGESTGSSPNFTYTNGNIGTAQFASGFTGAGWKIDRDGNEYNIETDNMTIRGTLSVYELLIQQIRATNGSIFVSAAAKVDTVTGSAYTETIVFEDPSDHGVCPFVAGDILLAQRVRLDSVTLVKRHVREVDSVSGKTIVCKATASGPSDVSGTAIESGDDFVRLGNSDSTNYGNRQGGVYLTADDSNAPFIDIFDGVTSWAQWTGYGKTKARLGKLDGITDTGSGLSGSQSDLYGLYSGDVYLTGHIQAKTGYIGTSASGFTIDSTTISNGQMVLNADNQTIQLGYVTDFTNNDSNLKGLFIGKDGDDYEFFLGQEDGNDQIHWNGSNLSIKGDITITNTDDFGDTDADNTAGNETFDSTDAARCIVSASGVEVQNSSGTSLANLSSSLRIGQIGDDKSRLEIDTDGNLEIINRQVSTDTTVIKLDKDGDATFTGTVTATNGYIGTAALGWDINSGHMVNGKVKLDAENQQIKLGDVTDFDPSSGSNKGVLMGKDGNTSVYEFFAGQEDGNYIHWNGTTLSVKGDITITNTGDFAPTGAEANDSAQDNDPAQNNPSTYNFGPSSQAGFDLADITPGAAGMYIGSEEMGYHDGTNWKTYMANSGNFYLAGEGAGGLSWTQSTSVLSIVGSITVSNPNDFAPTDATANQSDSTTNTAIAAKSKVFYQDDAPSSGHSTNDIWYDTNGGYKRYVYNGSSWVDSADTTYDQSSLITTAQNTANSRNTTFYQIAAPTALAIGDLWVDTDDNYKLWRAGAIGSGSWVAATPDPDVNTTTIVGNTVTTGFVNALNVNAETVTASWVYAGTLTANQIQVSGSNYSATKNWNFRGSTQSFTVDNGTFTAYDEYSTLDHSSGDARINSSAFSAIDGLVNRYIKIKFRRQAGAGWDGKIYWNGDAGVYGAGGYMTIPQTGQTVATSTWTTVLLDMHSLSSGGTNWKTDDAITNVRFDFGSTSSDNFDIEFISIGDLTDSPGTFIDADGIYTGTLNADNVNTGTLTGRTVQTAASGDRIVMDGSANTISLIEGTTSVARVLIDDDDSGPANVTAYETIDTVTLSNQYVPSSGYLESFVTDDYGDYKGRQCQVRINYTIGLTASMILWIQGSTNGSTYNNVYIHPYQSYSSSGAIYLPFMSLQYPYMRIKAQRTGGNSNSIKIDVAYWRVYDSFLELNHSGLNWSGNEIYSKLGPTHLVTGDSTNGRDVLLTRGTAHHYQYGGGGHESPGNPLVISSDESDSYRMHFWFSGADLHIEDKEGHGGYISGSTDYGVLTFTGQHRCIGNSGMTAEQYGEMVGYIVRADGNYNNMSDVDTPTINESLPVIELSDSDNDKKVFGVISSHEDGDSREMPTGSWVTTAVIEEGDERVIVNSLGEGAVWVTNINGDLENGDYITTSTAAGLGQKQSDDILHSYTVAKITQDCDFSSGTEFEHDGETYKKQFVGCTYHCG